jgi:hypothetical protein
MARPLKIFTIESHLSLAPHDALKALGGPSHIIQASMYVIARTKKDAAQFLINAGHTGCRADHVHETWSNYAVALREATSFLQAEGAVAIMSDSNRRVVVPGLHGWEVVGEFTFRDPENSHRMLPKPRFIIDKQRQVRPVRLVIELDADTDPAVIESFRVGLSVFVNSSIDDRAVGTVVEP